MRSRRITGVLVAASLTGACQHAPRRPASPPASAAFASASASASAMPAATAPDAPGPPLTRRRHIVVSSSIVILEPVRFGVATPAIDPRSEPMLDSIADTLVAQTDLELIEIRADGADAPAGARQQLGLARAVRVVDALVARGVARARLWPVGNIALSSSGPELVIVRRRSGQ